MPAIKGLDRKEQLLFIKIHNDVVTITPLMREILEVARTPHTVEELIQWVAKTYYFSYESIRPIVYSFLARIGRLGGLVYEENQPGSGPAIVDKIEQAKSFAGLTVLKRIAKSHKVAVYKCCKPGDDSSYFTLKVWLGRNPEASVKRDFFREFEILRALPAHRNIRSCLDASVYDGIPYLLFEYLSGVPMSDKVSQVSLATKIDIARQLMLAIDHLHGHGVLHGDIHASNFLLNQDNCLHLIDLGMAYAEQEDKIHHGGKPRYMPPERMPDHPLDFSATKGDYRSEVFQVGVCLYFLFSGRYPFNGLLLKDLATSIKYKAAAPLEKTPLGEMIPEHITRVISKSMEKAPGNRYDGVAEMMKAWELGIKNEEWSLTAVKT